MLLSRREDVWWRTRQASEFVGVELERKEAKYYNQESRTKGNLENVGGELQHQELSQRAVIMHRRLQVQVGHHPRSRSRGK